MISPTFQGAGTQTTRAGERLRLQLEADLAISNRSVSSWRIDVSWCERRSRGRLRSPWLPRRRRDWQRRIQRGRHPIADPRGILPIQYYRNRTNVIWKTPHILSKALSLCTNLKTLKDQGATKIQTLAKPVWRFQEEEKDLNRMAQIKEEVKKLKKCNILISIKSCTYCMTNWALKIVPVRNNDDYNMKTCGFTRACL